MATGDITVTVNADGISANLAVAGFTTGCTYAFGFAAKNVPGASTPYFTVTSLGYDNTGAATTVTRTVYLTIVNRFPFGTGFLTGVAGLGTFTDGETITQAVSGATGKVVGSQSSGTKLVFFVLTGTFNNANVCTGGTSGATFTSTSTFTAYAASTNDEELTPTGIIVSVALSENIYQKDNTGGGNSGTAPTVTIPAGFITNTGGAGQTSNALSAAAVTQSSTLAMSRAQANWAMVPRQRITGSSFNLRAVGFGEGANGGHPLACVVFTATDTHAHTATTTVTAMTIDATQGDNVPVQEYIAAMDMSTLTNGDLVTCQFKAYPWIGDSTCVVDTTDGVNTMPTPLYAPHVHVLDKSGTYGVTCARVASDGSDGGANTVYDSATFNETTAYKFLTIGKALAAIAAYNNTNHARNNCGAGKIVCENGTYSWTGTTNTYGSGSVTWCRVTRTAASTSRATVIISGTHSIGNAFGMGYVEFYDIAIVGATLGLGYGGASFTDSFWFNLCNTTLTNDSTIWDSACYLTQGNVGQCNDGLGPYAPTIKTFFGLVRGAQLAGFGGPIHPVYTVLGLLKSDAPSTTKNLFLFESSATQSVPVATPILAYINVKSWKGNVFLYDGAEFTTTTNGWAIVCVIVENIGAGAAPTAYPILDIAGQFVDTQTPNNNGRLWDSTFAGERCNLAYNTHTVNQSRNRWSVKNCIFEYLAKKSDTYAADSGGNGIRVSDWGCLYGVGYSGNLIADCLVTSAADFMLEWAGLKSYQPTRVGTAQPPAGTANAIGYVVFTNRQACSGAGAGAGGGDYTLQITSPAIAMARDQLLPYDVAGTARIANDAAGAYQYGAAVGGGTNPQQNHWGPKFLFR